MEKPFAWVKAKLAYALILSSLLSLFSLPARAHEVLPTIGDLTLTNGQVALELRINLEAFLAGIDLDQYTDTNEAEQAADYDALRALPEARIARRAVDLLPGWNALPVLQIDGTPAKLRSVGVEMPREVDDELARVARWTLHAALPDGAKEVIVTWPKGAGALVLRQQGVDAPFTGFLEGGKSSAPIQLAGGGAIEGWRVFGSYIPVGFDHILPKGLDHILFVLGLFFLTTRLRPLIWQISAFTLAHTVTLALGALGLVNIPGAIVEPLIAASIVYVAVENIFARKLHAWRPLVIFGFGLLHGLGFASVLGEFGLPQGQFVPALIGFNIGVELGQLTVIALAFGLVGWAAGQRWYHSRIAMPASAVIAGVGAWWFIERVFL